jgi:hypothetical protein
MKTAWMAQLDSFMGRVQGQMDAVVSSRAPGRDRVVGLVIGAPAITVLGLARYLDPSPNGFGTHTQLGLNGCTMMTFTGWPCPMCGMTTTFALMAEGRVVEAFINQPFGPFLFAITVIAAVAGAIDMVSGAGAWRALARALAKIEQGFAIFLLVGMFLGWLYKAWVMHPEAFGGA